MSLCIRDENKEEESDVRTLTIRDRGSHFMKIYDENGKPILVQMQSSFLINATNTATNRKKRRPWWLYVLFLAILFQILLYYGPPAPPQSELQETWYEFGLAKSREIIMPILDILLVIPFITRWCWKGIQYDVHEYLWKKNKRRTKCVQEWNNDDFWKEDDNNNSFLPIIQPRAQKVISQTFKAWKPDEKALVVVFSGTIGVGKKYVVNKLSQSLICNKEELLEINNNEYATRLHDLLPRLREHILRNHHYGNTIVIVINHAEDDGVLFEILDELSKTPRLVILITTHVGSKIIHRRILQQQEKNHEDGLVVSLSSPSLDWDIRDELDSKLGLGVSNYVTAIAPFV